MAKAKKKSKKTSKKVTKVAKKPAAPKQRKAKTKAARLSVSEKLVLLKPGADLDELIEDVVAAWRLVGSKLRVPDVTPAKLDALSRAAVKAAKKEAEVAAKQAAQLAPLTDARMRTGDAAYRTALKVKRIADAIGATDPEVADAFAAVSERFRRSPSAPSEPTPTS